MDDFDLRLWPEFEKAGGDPHAPAFINQVTIDSRQIDSKKSVFIALPGTQTDGHHFVNKAAELGASFAIVSLEFAQKNPLHPIKLLYVKNPIKALQEIAKAYRKELPTKIIAITGSYGKTMVKDLLHEILKDHFSCKASPESFNSQIGVPLSLFTLSKNHEIALIEAAISEKNEMRQLAEMLKPDFGIITPVGSKHLDRLGDMQTLISELLQLFTINNRLQWICLPDTKELEPFLHTLKAPLHFWNTYEPGIPHATRLSDKYEHSIPYRISFSNAPTYEGLITSGFNYFIDLLNMAIKAAFKLGVPSKSICKTLDHYILEPIKTEIWKSLLGITFINASYAEDPLSIDTALKFLEMHGGNKRKIFLFEGLKGNPTESDYKHVGDILSDYSLDILILIGDHNFDPLIKSFSHPHLATTIFKEKSYADAFETYKLTMHSGDTVLIKGQKKEPLEKLINYFHESICTNLCQINLSLVDHNIKILRKKLPSNTRIMVMVKAFAYGTDEIRIAKFLKTAGIDILGVSYVDEGIALKRAGITQSIFVLNAVDYEVKKVIKWDLEVGVSTLSNINLIAEEAKKNHKIIKVHLHVDTGMSRFGCRPEEALDLARHISKLSSLELTGIMTHFASADDPKEDDFTWSQGHKLEEAIQSIEKEGIFIPWKHAANSAGSLRFSFPQFNMVRIGLAIYGLQSFSEKTLGLRLAVSLISRIAGINICKKGDTISYGRDYLVQKDEMRIAVIPIGYFDGLHRNYSGRSSVLIRGKKAPMIGKICMDYMMVDVSDISDVHEGDPVLIFGEDDYGHYISPEDLATDGNSIIHELMTCLGPRIQRIFIYEESHQKTNEVFYDK